MQSFEIYGIDTRLLGNFNMHNVVKNLIKDKKIIEEVKENYEKDDIDFYLSCEKEDSSEDITEKFYVLLELAGYDVYCYDINSNDYYIGKSWSSIQENENQKVKEFKSQIQSEIQLYFGEKSICENISNLED